MSDAEYESLIEALQEWEGELPPELRELTVECKRLRAEVADMNMTVCRFGHPMVLRTEADTWRKAFETLADAMRGGK